MSHTRLDNAPWIASALFIVWAATAAAVPLPSSGTLSLGNPTLSWTGGNLAGANVNESTCQENITCETYMLTLAPGDYTGKRVEITMNWLLLANDYDLYVHVGTVAGETITSSGSSTTNFERAILSIEPPVVTTPRVYAVRAVAFAVAPGDNYTGGATIVNGPLPRSGTYLAGDLLFSDNVTLEAPFTTGDGEPSIRVDVRGNCYVGGIRGVPAGVDLWRIDLDPNSPTFDPGMQHAVYLGQPDAFLPMQDPNDPEVGGADGGGDIDISCSFPANPNATPVVTITSLAVANISSAVSTNRGQNFVLSPATAIAPSDDRQWNESTGDSRVYLFYRAPVPATGLFVQRSDDNGFTYPITGAVSPSGSTPGYIDVDHSNGRVYVSHTSDSALFVGRSSDNGLTWSNSTVDNSTSHGNLFDPVKVGQDGTVYTTWSDGHTIYMSHSTDGGVSWAEKVRVSDNSVYQTNMFPWLEAGSAGRVCIVWYGTTAAVNDDAADWSVLYSQTLNATATNPTFRQQVISDHIIHGSNISTGGLTGSANRNLLDYFQVALDPQGASVIAFTDDSNDYDGNLYVTRQVAGTSLYASANSGTGQVRPKIPPPLPSPDPMEPEVTDFLHDAVLGLLQPITTDSPFDILWVDYACEPHPVSSAPMMVAKMKVSSLSPVPAGGNWRISFAANAAGGVSDRGDQFYMLANSQNPLLPTFTWGTASRESDGSLTYTSRGNCDFGSIDAVNGTVTMKLQLQSLNAFVTHGPPVVPGSTFWGLRGRTSSAGANAILDITRGGTSFSSCLGGTSDVPDDEAVASVPTRLGEPVPNPGAPVSQIAFSLGRAGWVDLSIVDVAGRRVRTLHAGNLARGEHRQIWDGRTDRFTDAAAGVYFYVLHTTTGVQSRKVVLAR